MQHFSPPDAGCAAASELFATFDNLDPWCKVNFSHIGMSNFFDWFYICVLQKISNHCRKVSKVQFKA